MRNYHIYIGITFLIAIFSVYGGVRLFRMMKAQPEAPMPKTCVKLALDHLELKYMNPHICWSQEEIQEKIKFLIGNFTGLMQEGGYDHWMDSGTLLGSIRDGKIIYWDTDADFGVPLHVYEKLQESNTTNLPISKGFELTVLNSTNYPGPDRNPDLPIRFIDTTCGFYVDVFVFLPSKSRFGEEMLGPLPSPCWWGCYKCLGRGTVAATFIIPKTYIYPLSICELEGMHIPCPVKSKVYLEHLYGPKYMEPYKFH